MRGIKVVLISTVSAIAAFVGGVTVERGRAICPTTQLLSPDDMQVAILTEENRDWMERDFRVDIADVRSQGRRNVFRSPDEGVPRGSERFLWSSDSHYVLLLGRHFIVPSTAVLSSGEIIYLLVDTKSGRIWCNATQASTERFSKADLDDKGFPPL